MPDGIVGAEAHKPKEQQVVVEMLQQKPLRADGVERLLQRSQQQLLGRDRWPSLCGVQLTEGVIQSIEGLIRQHLDPVQRVRNRDPLLDRDVVE